MKSRFDIPSKDKLYYAGPALTQRSDHMLQSLVEASLKGRDLCMRKGSALNAPNDFFSYQTKIKARSTHYETTNIYSRRPVKTISFLRLNEFIFYT